MPERLFKSSGSQTVGQDPKAKMAEEEGQGKLGVETLGSLMPDLGFPLQNVGDLPEIKLVT